MPFRSLSPDNLISRGAAGHVFPNIVLNCPTQFDNALPEQIKEMGDSAKRIGAEKTVYRLLMEHPHPNIVQERWVLQLTSTVAWLERLGLVHGDLRPANILLDANDDIRISDCDAAFKPGAELVVASEPFCKMDANFETPPAGPVSEQFSLASCIYTIRFGRWPWHELDPPARVRKLVRNEFPSASADPVLGDVTARCWRGVYASIASVHQDVLSRLGRSVAKHETLMQAPLEEVDAQYPLLRAECEEFVAKQALG